MYLDHFSNNSKNSIRVVYGMKCFYYIDITSDHYVIKRNRYTMLHYLSIMIHSVKFRFLKINAVIQLLGKVLWLLLLVVMVITHVIMNLLLVAFGHS